jgi:octanoyl-[GcvH]:protein N-octanoyltransferase
VTLTLHATAFPDDAPLDAAFSHALLARVAHGELGDAFRLARPGRMVSFGRVDALAPGFRDAVRAAERHGFAGIHRVGGGRAAVFHEGTILFGHATWEADARAGTRIRFVRMAERLARALRRLGIDAAVGELPGEYCPGAWSVHAGGVKLMGVAQRVVHGAAWTEGVIVVGGGTLTRDVLVPVYRALGVEWDPRTAGAAGVDFDAAVAAVRAELAAEFELVDAEPDAATLALAHELRPRHDARALGGPGSAEREKVAL